MLQRQPSDKLHTACDECRTRKLKCSGEKPQCFRCMREKLDCMYSPQKQMGRPRKRRREGDAEASEDISQVMEANHSNESHVPQELPSYGILSPSSHEDMMYPAGSSAGLSQAPSILLDGSGSFEVTPISAEEYAKSLSRTNKAKVSSLSTDFPIDPCLWDASQPNIISQEPSAQIVMAPCTCLSLMYLTITELQSMSSFAFPQVVVPLRKAMGVLSDIIHCPQCPKEAFSGMQNVQSVVGLFQAIIERFQKVLSAIDDEAKELERTGTKKPYRVGDANPALVHLHTATPDCPLGFNIEFEAKDWKRLAKTVLKTEIHGSGSNPRPLILLLKEAIARQKRWHEGSATLEAGRKKCSNSLPSNGTDKCHALGADRIQHMVDQLKWE